MPMALSFSHALMQELAEIRKNEESMPYLRPDSKAQVTVEYEDDGQTVKRIHTIVVSTQHAPDVQMETIRNDVRDILIPRVIPSDLLDDGRHSTCKSHWTVCHWGASWRHRPNRPQNHCGHVRR